MRQVIKEFPGDFFIQRRRKLFVWKQELEKLFFFDEKINKHAVITITSHKHNFSVDLTFVQLLHNMKNNSRVAQRLYFPITLFVFTDAILIPKIHYPKPTLTLQSLFEYTPVLGEIFFDEFFPVYRFASGFW